jgi:hypothetical protein
MPCYTIQTVSVNLGKANLDLLEQALQVIYPRTVLRTGDVIRFNNGESYNATTQELRIRNADSAKLIKRAYSAEVVKSQAKRFGWAIKETAPFQFEVQKR